jgi:hypothetical protein
MHHCSSLNSCHEHVVQDFAHVASGSFVAPDHEYPFHLELRLTATDADGLSDTNSVRLEPKTVELSFRSDPAGLQLTVGSSSATTPFSRMVIAGSKNSISAPSPQTLAGTSYEFASWSDGGAQSHDVVAPDAAAPYTATYTPSPDTTAPTAKARKHTFTTLSTLGTTTVPVKLTWSATDNSGGSGIASYQLQQSVNEGAYTTVELLPSATATTISPSLAPGTNTYRYRVAAKDKAGNLSAWVAGPSFKVSTYQESSSAIVDTGSWTTSALSGAYGGSVQYASTLGRNVTFSVPATTKNVEWVSYRSNRGKAQVWLDGVQQDAKPTMTGIQPFDLYSSSAQARKVIFSKAVSPTTSHKLEVRVLGQKNASSTSTRVDIDAFVRTS